MKNGDEKYILCKGCGRKLLKSKNHTVCKKCVNNAVKVLSAIVFENGRV